MLFSESFRTWPTLTVATSHCTWRLWSKCQSSHYIEKRWAVWNCFLGDEVSWRVQVWDLSILFLRVHQGFGPSQLGWRHAGITTDGSLWAYAMSGDVWGCLGYSRCSPIAWSWYSTNGYQWYSWWGIADSQVSPCSVSFVYFVSFASFLIPEVFLAVTERINDSIKLWCLFFLEFSVQAYVRCFPLLAMAVSLMIALRSQCICKTQG